MRLSELAGVVDDGDPVVMVDGPDGWPVPVTGYDVGAMQVPGVGVVQCLILESRTEEDG